MTSVRFVSPTSTDLWTSIDFNVDLIEKPTIYSETHKHVYIEDKSFLTGVSLSIDASMLSHISDVCFHFCRGDMIVESLPADLNFLLLASNASPQLTWFSECFLLLRCSGFDKLVSNHVLFYCALADSTLSAALCSDSLPIMRRYKTFYSDHRNRVLMPIYFSVCQDQLFCGAILHNLSISCQPVVANRAVNNTLESSRFVVQTKAPSNEKRLECWPDWWLGCQESLMWRKMYCGIFPSDPVDLLYLTPSRFILLSIDDPDRNTPDGSFFTKAIIQWNDADAIVYDSQDCFLRRVRNNYYYLFSYDAQAAANELLHSAKSDLLSNTLQTHGTDAVRKMVYNTAVSVRLLGLHGDTIGRNQTCSYYVKTPDLYSYKDGAA